nr:MAG TPA: hypothetical protein [Caudoviricetes sp.]
MGFRTGVRFSSGPLNESYPNTVGPLIYSGFVAFAFRLTLAEKTQ